MHSAGWCPCKLGLGSHSQCFHHSTLHTCLCRYQFVKDQHYSFAGAVPVVTPPAQVYPYPTDAACTTPQPPQQLPCPAMVRGLDSSCTLFACVCLLAATSTLCHSATNICVVSRHSCLSAVCVCTPSPCSCPLTRSGAALVHSTTLHVKSGGARGRFTASQVASPAAAPAAGTSRTQ